MPIGLRAGQRYAVEQRIGVALAQTAHVDEAAIDDVGAHHATRCLGGVSIGGLGDLDAAHGVSRGRGPPSGQDQAFHAGAVGLGLDLDHVHGFLVGHQPRVDLHDLACGHHDALHPLGLVQLVEEPNGIRPRLQLEPKASVEIGDGLELGTNYRDGGLGQRLFQLGVGEHTPDHALALRRRARGALFPGDSGVGRRRRRVGWLLRLCRRRRHLVAFFVFRRLCERKATGHEQQRQDG